MLALIGICVVNVPFMALPVEAVFIAPDSMHDKAAAFFVEGFLQLKFFILFSFIFGWGMAIQARSAESKGISFTRRYFLRMAGLATFGIAHAILVFSGDILLLYALLGMLLWLIKDYSPRQLMKLAAWMMPLSMFLLTVLAIILDAINADETVLQATTNNVNLGGTFIEATQARIADWPVTFTFLLFLQGPLAFGAFAAGLAAAKTDFFSDNSYGITQLKKRLPLLFLLALPLNILYAATVGDILPKAYELLSLFGFILIAIGAPALSAIYLYLFIQLARYIKLPTILILAGQNSLSSYIAQGVIAGIFFGAYGFGLFDSLGHAALIPMSLMIALSAMLLVGIYAKVFGRGPLEPILRKITGS
jgi:uncharacterized protein